MKNDMKEIAKREQLSPEARELLNQHLPSATKRNLYTASITRDTPALIVLLLDQSGSMQEQIYFQGRPVSKAQAVAEAVDGLLEELLNRCRKAEGIRDYFNICLLGYGGREEEAYIAWEDQLAGKKFALPSEVNAYPIRIKRVMTEKNIRGHVMRYEKEVRSWVNSVARYATPMNAGLNLTKELVSDWINKQRGKDVFPPLIFHVTDGQATDADEQTLKVVARQLKELHTADGSTLFYNIHLSSLANEPILFPSTSNELPKKDRFAHLLFNMSSTLPDIMSEEVRVVFGKNGRHPMKAMGYNTGVAEVIKLLNIGTSTSFARLTMD